MLKFGAAVLFALFISDLSPLARSLWVAGMTSCALLLWRLFRNGLMARYRWFAAVIAAHLVRSVALSGFATNTNAYALLWMASAPVLWLLTVLAVLELHSLALGGMRAIATVGRRFMLVSLAIAISLSCASLIPQIQSRAEPYPVLAFFANVERGLLSGLVFFVVLVCVFLVLYPVPVTRNVLAHAAISSVYFLGSILALLARLVTGVAVTPLINTLMSVVSLLTLLAWCVCLTAEGELLPARSQAQADPEAEFSRFSMLNRALIEALEKRNSGNQTVN